MFIKYFKQNGVSKNMLGVNFYIKAEDYPKVVDEVLEFERKMNEKIKDLEK